MRFKRKFGLLVVGEKNFFQKEVFAEVVSVFSRMQKVV